MKSINYGIAKNPLFVDGNKRTAAVLCELFIMVNDMSLEASDQEMLSVFLALAEGSLNEDQLANWSRPHPFPKKARASEEAPHHVV